METAGDLVASTAAFGHRWSCTAVHCVLWVIRAGDPGVGRTQGSIAA